MNPRVYFYCRDNPRSYHDAIVVLADGLRQIGAEVFSNCNYWRRSLAPDDWLLRADARVRPEDCDIVVLDGVWARWLDDDFKAIEQPLPPGLFAPGRRYRTAYLDNDDGYETPSWQPAYRAFDAIFRSQFNARCYHPANHHPWALAINHRMLEMIGEVPAWDRRKHEVLVNFGASHPYLHSARAQAGPPFIAAARSHYAINEQRDNLKDPPAGEYDRLMWNQTQRRHCRAYYERLKAAQVVAAFCGELIPPAPFHPKYLAGGGRARLSRRLYDVLAHVDPRPPRLIQWDSWRFWEGLAAGCLVYNLDLPHYGVLLPVMPEDGVHYVAMRPDNAAEVITRIERSPGLAERIARQGQAWALQHYTPAALARRFLATMLG